MRKYVYTFIDGVAEGKGAWRDLLGGKGAGLAEMTALGIRVPPGFTISTEACRAYFAAGNRFPEGLWEEVLAALGRVEAAMNLRYGDPARPLLLSVRSGAPVSMPGMLDTVLNLGLNDDTVQGLIAASGNPRFAYDAYRRFVTMFGNVVLGVPHEAFEKLLEAAKQRAGVEADHELPAEALKALIAPMKALIREKTGRDFPEAPSEQLRLSIAAVFASWYNDRAVAYRQLHRIPETMGTAVNVQAMVFGNLGDDSGTGVVFTRNPATGEKGLFGEFLLNAQGEDVVAGIRTPQPVSALRQAMPEVYAELEAVCQRLERHFRDMQDVEFTVQARVLYLLQTRTGKRTAPAAVRIAVDMVHEGLITQREALLRVEPEHIDQLLHPMVDPQATVTVIGRGLPASPGAACGQVVFSAAEAVRRHARGAAVILVRQETSPEDIRGMSAAAGILTARGGMTSHAAVVARGMGKCCVVGCQELSIHEEERYCQLGGHVIREGDILTLDGATGRVILGEAPLTTAELGAHFAELMGWADAHRRLGVRSNADTPHDAEASRRFGAEGIGLCRTEHMFFAADRIMAVRQMIIADDAAQRQQALRQIQAMQKEDFKAIFRIMDGLPVTIRLLDPPLHEFLPHTAEEIDALAAYMQQPAHALRQRVEALREANPMLGHRGCRLGITRPEIYKMQVRAILEAACELTRQGVQVLPEIMIPLVSHVQELAVIKRDVQEVAKQVLQEQGVTVPYLVGTMIELPRAALTAGAIAREAEFFSFGTNDLTQTCFGLSRDDAGSFLPYYLEHGILPEDPFVVLDEEGVGELVRVGVERGRQTRPQLKVGICGEHGGEPRSVAFCHRIGLDYVSCSPYRVPVARLAAAHAALQAESPAKAPESEG
ncbi:MAG: pyruvate, phosphate dikinase [Candidatus Tectimicrobiota bacterium]|nr:MAG: pyruvate, phosphate dikinase [Candidatus Tectomicrobia bacterium]